MNERGEKIKNRETYRYIRIYKHIFTPMCLPAGTVYIFFSGFLLLVFFVYVRTTCTNPRTDFSCAFCLTNVFFYFLFYLRILLVWEEEEVEQISYYLTGSDYGIL